MFRPVSAYAMFFKERQMVVKKSFPEATFGDISRIVAGEWDSLGKEEKAAYKRRTDHLRKMQIELAVKGRVERICKNVTEGMNEAKFEETQMKRCASALVDRQVCKNKFHSLKM
ncbi:unnamed protein product [Strongylus vulgaris]|uniref:HMG box domain-containing protein n=1 Tax=Strongylus vulgaris TaxID=40348 RepID=A0A3P7IFU0_STRVU|nr:unnamed protein product [Strongylus vulgaris]